MRALPSILAVACAAFAFAPAAHAGLDIDFGAAVTLGDDDDVFISVAAHYSDHDKERVRDLGYRYENPDDLAVALFVMKHSGRRAEEIWRLRKAGLTWHEISIRVGLHDDHFFLPVRRAPGPPYGKAYGHWKNKRKKKAHRYALTDADVRNLVAVRMLHDYYGVSVEAAMEWRASGKDVRSLVSNEYRRRHAAKHEAKQKAKHRAEHRAEKREKAKGKKH